MKIEKSAKGEVVDWLGSEAVEGTGPKAEVMSVDDR
jgi:hypothetical protein